MTSIAARVVRATDNSVHQWLPADVAEPTSADEVVRLVVENNDRREPLAVCARGGGTSTNGQCLTDGLVIDTRRHLHHIIDIDVAGRRAVVEPGVVAGKLDEVLAPHGLFWAPHTSTRNRATVGGMIATDAAGKGSLLHGRTNRHVESLDVVLADGTRWLARPLPLEQARAEAERPGTVGEVWRVLLGLAELGPFDLPELARGFSGYGIARVHHDGLVDPIPVLCGAEGTLGVVVGATLRLTELPHHTTLIVAAYPSIDAALRDAVELSGHDPERPPPVLPSAIEVSDVVTLQRGSFSPAWPRLQPHVPNGTAAILLCEYDLASDVPMIDALLATLASTGRSSSRSMVDRPGDRAAIWKVREDAVGLLARVPHGAPRPTAFVEDCAVPVADLPAFIADFRALLDDRGLDYAMFGHADVGCVHVRPALDPISETHEALIGEITAEVLDLLDRYGGILWGEHGRGLRSSVVDNVLSPALIHTMRTVKSAFDPLDRMNPGKLYRPLDAAAPLLGLDEVPRRSSHDRAVPVSIRSAYSHAFDCNGNGLCHHFGDSEVMCPSFKATNDPVQAPKGRTDLIRAWLHADAGGGRGDRAAAASPNDADALADAVAESLRTCLSCGACTGRCPVQVDIPELKSRFFEAYHRTRRRPLRDHVLSRFESLVPLAQRVPGRNGPLPRWAARRIGLVDLPHLPARPSGATLRHFDPGAAGGAVVGEAGAEHTIVGVDVVVLADVFTSVFDRDELVAAVALLEVAGYRTAVAPLVPTAKFDHVKGLRTRFARAAAEQRRLIEQIERAGAVAVSLDPAIALMHRHDYSKVDPSYPSHTVRPLIDLLVDRADRLPQATERQTLRLFGHCTEQALAPHWIQGWADLLTAAGHEVDRVATGCCGMAGVFGHEAEHAPMSRQLFEQLWRPHLGIGTAVATGWSCRSQAERHHEHIVSPVAILAQGLSDG